jgi:hypothetical protein
MVYSLRFAIRFLAFNAFATRLAGLRPISAMISLVAATSSFLTKAMRPAGLTGVFSF